MQLSLFLERPRGFRLGFGSLRFNGGFRVGADALELGDERRDASLGPLDLVREGADLGRGVLGGGRVFLGE